MTTSEFIDVLNPATEASLARIPSVTAEGALEAVDRAADALHSWRSTTPRHRAELLRAAFETMIDNADELALLITDEQGKPLSEAQGEIRYAAEFFRWYAEEAPRIDGYYGRSPSGAHDIVVGHQPVGVSILVTPWNFPAAMATRKIAPALAAGCTVVLKPATETPLTALRLAALFDEVGIPKGVINVVPTLDSARVVQAMLQHPEVSKISFTGSTEVGRILLRQAAERVLNCSMELGGNAPAIVLEDVDVNQATEQLLIAKMRNTGESCIAANRILVPRKLLPQIAERLAVAMGAMKLGPGREPGTEVGPLVNAKACESVSQLVDRAIAQGARALVGGKTWGEVGHFYEPTVLVDVAPDAEIARSEIFGPVAPFIAYDDLDEALVYANQTEMGLAAYVFGRNQGHCMHVAQQLQAGVVGINRGLISDPAAPFGGMKQSGIGREGAHHGIAEFLEPQYMAVNRQ